jgi:hypothetical protein
MSKPSYALNLLCSSAALLLLGNCGGEFPDDSEAPEDFGEEADQGVETIQQAVFDISTSFESGSWSPYLTTVKCDATSATIPTSSSAHGGTRYARWYTTSPNAVCMRYGKVTVPNNRKLNVRWYMWTPGTDNRSRFIVSLIQDSNGTSRGSKTINNGTRESWSYSSLGWSNTTGSSVVIKISIQATNLLYDEKFDFRVDDIRVWDSAIP